MIKAVFLDNDGVLVDTEHLYFEATRRIFERIGGSLSSETFVEHFLRQGGGTWFLLEERGWTPAEIGALRAERNAIYAAMLVTEPILIPGAGEALERLRGRVLLGIVTSSRRDHFEIMHRRTGILPLVDFALTLEDYEKAKPDPAPYRMAILRSGSAPAECAAVEDSERGLRAASAAGLRCLVVPRGLTSAGNFAGAFRICRSLDEAVDEILAES